MSDLLLASTNLSTRAINILARNNILPLSQLKECSEKELRSMRGLGGKTLDEIVTFRDNPLDEETADETMNAEGMFCVALTPEILNSLSYHQITEIDMSARGFHYLTLMGCTTIAQLVRLKREDFQKTANIGEKTIEIIEESTKKWLLENGYYGDGSVLQTIPNADAESSTNTIFGRILTSEMRTSLSFHNVSELNLSSRAANALIRGNYTTLDKIAELSIPKLTATKGIGLNTVNDIITQTRNWLTVNSYYESENFNISDNEKDLFEKLHSAFHFFLSVNPLQLLDACRKEAGYSSLIESYNGEITGCVISKFLEISFVRESIKEWFRQTSTSIGEGTESMPEEKFAEIIYNRIEEQYAQLLLNMEPHTLDEDFEYKKICGFEINGIRFEVSSWQDALIQLCSYLYNIDGNKMLGFVDDPYFKRRKVSYFMKESVPRRNKIIPGTNLYVWVNNNANTLVRLMRDMLVRYLISPETMTLYLRRDLSSLH